MEATGDFSHQIPLASRLLKVQAVLLDLRQVGYHQIGWIEIMTLDNTRAHSQRIIQGAQTVEIPQWLQLFRIRFHAKKYLFSGSVVVYRLPPPSPNEEPDGITGLYSAENPPPNWINW